MKTSELYEKNMQLSGKGFKQVIGVKKGTFQAMLEVVEAAYAAKHKRRGRHSKLTVDQILFLALKYWRHYVTQLLLSVEFGVGEATVHDTIVWVENTLVKDEKFKLPGKKALLEDDSIEIILVDVTECPIERPKKNSGNGTPAKRNGTR